LFRTFFSVFSPRKEQEKKIKQFVYPHQPAPPIIFCGWRLGFVGEKTKNPGGGGGGTETRGIDRGGLQTLTFSFAPPHPRRKKTMFAKVFCWGGGEGRFKSEVFWPGFGGGGPPPKPKGAKPVDLNNRVVGRKIKKQKKNILAVRAPPNKKNKILFPLYPNLSAKFTAGTGEHKRGKFLLGAVSKRS